MDGKGSRGLHTENNRRRQNSVTKYGKQAIHYVKAHKQGFLAGILLMMMIALLFGIFSQFQAPTVNAATGSETNINYSTFIAQVKAGNVVAVTIRGQDIQGLLAQPLSQHTAVALSPSDRAAQFTAFSRYVGAGSTSLLLSNHVMVTTLPQNSSPIWLSILWRFAPFLLLFLILLVLLAPKSHARTTRGIDERVSQFGKSKVRRFERVSESTEKPISSTKATKTPPTVKVVSTAAARKRVESTVTFADVAGIDEVREELEEIVQFLRNSDRYDKLGARIPRGALLVGPPGTGKTLLAKAVAGEAGVPFFSMSASEFVEMFVGVGASRVRDLFNQARQVAPSVIFIDEIDAVGRKRTMRVAGNDERDQTLNQLLVELDGFDPRKAVVVMAATNRVDMLDKALLRPGRFDRRITVSLPDRIGREAILKVHTRRTPLHEEVDLVRLARMTTGMSGADLANLVNEAALSAARQDLEHITHACFEDALARVQLGALRPIVMSERERRIIAIHEGGHALVAHHLPEADTVNRVTILPRGQSLGVTQFTSEEDRYNYSRQTLMARIAVGLGGRVAEELTFGHDYITTGAENDLQVVTDLARRMVTRWGMSEEVGVVFADYQAQGDASLNMKRFEPDAFPVQARSLAVDANGNLVLNGALPPRPTLSMAIPAPQSTGGVMMNALVDAEVRRILNEGRAMARAILTEHNDQLLLLADTLMECEQLDRAQFEALLQA